MRWINAYRTNPEPAGMPAAVKALSRFGSFKDPEQSGVFVGFLAGVIATNPDKAEQLVNKMLPLPPGDQWVVVRAIAYSGHPDWRNMLRRFSAKLRPQGNDRQVSERTAAAPLPISARAACIELGFCSRARSPARAAQGQCSSRAPNCSTLIGATISRPDARPIGRIIEMLAWSVRGQRRKAHPRQHGEIHLASNASRDPELMVTLREAHERTPKRPRGSGAGDRCGRDGQTPSCARAFAAIEELRRKGLPTGATSRGGVRSARVRWRSAASRPRARPSLPWTALCDYGRRSSAALSAWEKQ
jgi:hypothetical protein